jgi:hypothetical protein
MSDPEKTLRRQLLEAREKLSRQIEIMEAGPAFAKGVYDFQPGVIAELKAELARVDQSLADLGLDDA